MCLSKRILGLKLSQRQKGLVFAILAPLFYALQSVMIKFSPTGKVEFFVFFRVLFNFLLLTPFFLKHRKELHSKQLPLHFVRAILASISNYCSVYGIRHLALVDAVLLESTLSLFIPVIAWMWRGQKITAYSCFILMVGFSALFFLLQPKLDILHLASFASLGTGLTAAITKVSISKLSKTEHLFAMLFYSNLFSGTLTLIPCLYLYNWNNMLSACSLFFCLPFVFISFFSVLFQYAGTRAYSLLPAHVAGNFAYFAILFSGLFGWLIWQETLSMMQIFGGTLLIGSGLFMIHENRRRSAFGKALLVPLDE